MTPRIAFLSAALLCLTACTATAPRSASTLHGDPAHPEATTNWVRTELYFGLGPADAANAGAGESRWREFLDHEVSTRFPDGLSVYDVYGQWRDRGAAEPERLRSKVLLLLYPDTPQHRADVEAIRAAWKRASGDASVLRVTQPADVSF
ncbi:DUF3574 domain-containing protein [Dokdonella sp.]|uniref:DUF3574 domain-containing protein n=1 Tax=Dokdonella sp. TaxID=2291710 RepID=UPI001B2D0C15|nr:DUF3574 domain-containing protein [Dokdonella sp.]MBO9662114.1 DUF3574 domain-containing protein [Dokdonella sp.]